MANILFKRGLKANLASAAISDGNVYVTTDEGAMYVDVGNARVRLGDFKEYASFDTLQGLSTNQLDTQALYYVSSGNMLLKWNGMGQSSDPGVTTPVNLGWTQINSPSTLSSMGITIKTSPTSITNGVDVKATIKEGNNISAEPHTNYVSADATLLKISGTTDNLNNYAIVTFTPADIVENASLSIAEHATASNTAVLTITNNKTGTDAAGTAVSDSTNTSSINIRGSGIAITEDNGALVLTNTGGVTAVSQNFDGNGKLTTNLTLNTNDTVSNSVTGYVTPTITYGDTTLSANLTSATFVNGTAALSVYTKSEVDTKLSNELRAINAMTFKGTLGSGVSDTSLDLPTSNVSNGDVYKVAENGTYNSIACRVGDMFIAVGTEGNDGYIPSGSLNWAYIPSGDDESAFYALRYNTNNQKIELIDANNQAVSSITAGSDLVFSGTGANVTIAHNTVTRTDTTGTATSSSPGSDFTFNVVTGVTTSTTGHITGVQTTQFTVTNTFNQLTSVTATVASMSGTGDNTQINVKVADTLNSSGMTAAIKLHSDSLTFARDTTNQVTSIDLTWGSF